MQQLSTLWLLMQIRIKKATKLMVKLLKHPKMPKMLSPSLKDLWLQPHDLFSL